MQNLIISVFTCNISQVKFIKRKGPITSSRRMHKSNREWTRAKNKLVLNISIEDLSIFTILSNIDSVNQRRHDNKDYRFFLIIFIGN